MSAAPRFSVVTPVYDTPAAMLRDAVASVVAQTYGDWELVLVDDASPAPHVAPLLDELAVGDPRIRVLRRAENGGIVAASNDGLAAARGEFVALLDHDDLLHPEALSKVNHQIVYAPVPDEVDYVYTDEDKIDLDGNHTQPFHKPDWSPDRFRCQPYTSHLSVLRRSLLTEVGGFRPGFDGSQDFDLFFRVTERARSIIHVPEILYHWRLLEGSTAVDEDAKPYAWVSGQRAIAEHCERTGFEAEPELRDKGLYGLIPRLREHPLVSLVIPTAASFREIHGRRVLLAEQCVRSVVERSTYDNYEIVLVADHHVDSDLLKRIEIAGADRIRIVEYRKPFNFADKCNVGVVLSHGRHIVLLNDDTEVINPGWMESMLMYSRSPGVGAVGARLLFGDGRIQHVGVATFRRGQAGHIYPGYPRDFPGYFNVARTPCNYSAVTAACLMSPREVYESLGGLSVDFPVNFNDVDYCLKVREAGLRVVYDPNAELYHYESSTRPARVLQEEIDLIEERWRHLGVDPYLHPRIGSANYVLI